MLGLPRKHDTSELEKCKCVLCTRYKVPDNSYQVCPISEVGEVEGSAWFGRTLLCNRPRPRFLVPDTGMPPAAVLPIFAFMSSTYVPSSNRVSCTRYQVPYQVCNGTRVSGRHLSRGHVRGHTWRRGHGDTLIVSL